MMWLRRLLAIGAIICGLAMVGTASASAVDLFPDCKDAPPAVSANDGFTGWVDPVDGSTDTRLSNYGYKYRWHTYDLGCNPVGGADARFDTTIGNFFLSAAAGSVAVANAGHKLAADPGELIQPIDNLVTQMTQALRTAIFDPWVGVVLTVVGVVALWSAWSGALSQVASQAVWVFLVLTVTVGVMEGPTRIVDWLDDARAATIGEVNAQAMGMVSGDIAGESSNALIVDSVLWDTWLAGMVGTQPSDTARNAAEDLWVAQSIGATEPRDGSTLEKKAKQFEETMSSLQSSDAAAYQQAQGKSGGRAGWGLKAFLGAAFTTWFRALTDWFMIAAYLVLRLLAMSLPVLAVAALFPAFRAVVFGALNIAGASVINVVALGVASAIHIVGVSALVNGGLNPARLLLAGLFTLVMLWACWPLFSFRRIAGFGGPRAGESFVRKVGKVGVTYLTTRAAIDDATDDIAQNTAASAASAPAGAGPHGPVGTGPSSSRRETSPGGGASHVHYLERLPAARSEPEPSELSAGAWSRTPQPALPAGRSSNPGSENVYVATRSGAVRSEVRTSSGDEVIVINPDQILDAEPT